MPATQHSALGTQHLLSDSQLIDDRAVSLLVGLFEVVQKTAAAADELQQSAPAVVILRVRFEVFGQIADAVRQKGDLHFGRAGVTVVGAILRNQVRFLLLGAWQNTVSLASYRGNKYTFSSKLRHDNSGRGQNQSRGSQGRRGEPRSARRG